ncbi:polysaccharide deacetylase family protein [Sphaerisporangium fuscum]|uniref:polysaccharide deacetylase family protein n=1 Tax=Sphaerisporangium fuscum TaxID=2835868 RepID=UPI001BDC5BE2|nr:polysaccharide deacetylase family protein [Sphaerisporangium fuscum]
MSLSVSRCVAVTLAALLTLVTTACGGEKAGERPPGAARTVVALTFDDGWATQSTAAELLRKHHLTGTFYINSGFLGRPKRLTKAQVDGLVAAGNEIGGHTLTHPRLPTLPEAAQRREICDDRRALIDMGYKPRSFAYPYGMFDATTMTLARECGYDSARRSGGIAPPSDPCPKCARSEDVTRTDHYRLRSLPAVRATVTLDTLKEYVTQAEKRGGGLVTYQFHNVCDGCDPFGVSPRVLDGLLGWLAASGVQVRLFGDVVGGPFRPAPPAHTGAGPAPRLSAGA